MVKTSSLALVALLSLSTLSSGCGIKGIWGEPPPPAVVIQPTSDGSECAPAQRILDGDDLLAQMTLNCLSSKIDTAWTQVQGRQKETLSDSEISTLIRKRIINLEPQIEKLLAAKKLLGFEGPATRAGVDRLMSWTRQHLSTIRSLYRKYYKKEEATSFSDMDLALEALESFLKTTQWTVSWDQFAVSLRPVLSHRALEVSYSVRKLIGLDKSNVNESLAEWITWARQNRNNLEVIYSRFYKFEQPATYDDFEAGSRAFSSLFGKMNWSMSAQDLAATLSPLIQTDNLYIRNSIFPAVRVGINSVAMLCPTVSDRKYFNTQEAAACISKIVPHFRSGGLWFDILMDPEKVTRVSPSAIIQSLDPFSTIVTESWFKQDKLAALETRLWIDLAQELGADINADSLSSISWISKFDPESSQHMIRPMFFRVLAKIVNSYERHLLDGVPYFVSALRDGKCANQQAHPVHWQDCQLQITDEMRKASPSIDLLGKIRNDHFGAKVIPLDGNLFSKIMLYDALSLQIMIAFDSRANVGRDEERILHFNSKDADNDVLKLLTAALNAFEESDRMLNMIKRALLRSKGSQPAEEATPSAPGDKLPPADAVRSANAPFAENCNRLVNHPVCEDDPYKTFHGDDRRKGMAKVVAFSGDILVRRTQEEKNFFKNLIANITNSFPESNTHLDQLALTGALATLDSLGDYKDYYLSITKKPDNQNGNGEQKPVNAIEQVALPTGELFVNKASIIQTLPTILRESFERTFASCEKFGFDRSCGLSYDEILPKPLQDQNGYISAGNLDLVTLIAVGFEGLFDACNYEGNDNLNWDLIDGNDELDCAMTKGKDIGERLMEAGIAKDNKLITMLLDVLNGTFVTRVPGKIALVRGSYTGTWWRVPLFPFYNHATIGSMYGLLGEVLNGDRAKEIEKRRAAR